MTDRSEVSRTDHEFQCGGCDAWFPHSEAHLDEDGEPWCEMCGRCELIARVDELRHALVDANVTGVTRLQSVRPADLLAAFPDAEARTFVAADDGRPYAIDTVAIAVTNDGRCRIEANLHRNPTPAELEELERDGEETSYRSVLK